MKIFLDSANLDEIIEINELGIIDGITTNPSLISKEGKSLKVIIEKICKIIKTDVSVEVISETVPLMIEEANEILSIAPNIVIKLPMTWAGIKVCKYLIDKGNKVNMTLCFTTNQALLAAKVGTTYISPFIGRLDDISIEGMNLIRDIRNIYNHYKFDTKILAASVRSPFHFHQAAINGSDLITVSGRILKQLISHPLTTNGLEIFNQDWKKLNPIT